jgi:flagellum-specific ATP synthase/type III secretion protein N (ATPase)
VRVSLDCLGRVLDGLGRPLDGGPELTGEEMPITAAPPAALARVPIADPVETGVAAIDGFLTCGRGQRLGIFSGSGVGKSTLLGMIAKNSDADVNVVALVGERGREVKEFIEDTLGREGMAKSVLVVATSDASPLLRFKATFTAVAVAEYFRDAGKRVLLVMDSVTRFAAAAREIGLAAGEPPTLRGYPPSLFAQLPKVVERLGVTERGSITGLFTVLVEGDDLNEPVSDTMRGLLDGHVILDRAVAARGNFPAIQVLDSVSRLMPRLLSPEQLESARELRAMLAIYEESRELIQVGAYQAGTDERLDRAIAAMPAIERILYHATARRRAEETWPRIMEVAGGASRVTAPGGVQNGQSPSG